MQLRLGGDAYDGWGELWEWLMLLYCKHNISGPCNKSCAVLILLDVSQVETLLSLQIHMTPRASDRLINICDREPLSFRAKESDVIKTCSLELRHPRPKGIRAFAPKSSSILKAEITVRKSGNACSHCQSHLSLLCQLQHILWGAILKLRHQQERQIPALWDSCFMIRITNWIVWGRIMYRNTKMLFSLIWRSLAPDFRIYETLCRHM